MRVFKTLTKPIRVVWREYKRVKNRPNMPCDFTEGITQNDLVDFSNQAVKSIRGRKIEITIEEAIVRGSVESNTGLSTWRFKIDFNDYGHITGQYWLKYENHDSRVPIVIAEKISDLIIDKLSNSR